MIGRTRMLQLLRIVESFGPNGATAREFGMRAFPHSTHWQDLPKHPRHDSVPGGRMVSASAALLARMTGLVIRQNGRYFLTQSGFDRIAAEHERSHAQPHAALGQGVPAAPAPVARWVDGAGVWWCSDGRHTWAWSGTQWVLWQRMPGR